MAKKHYNVVKVVAKFPVDPGDLDSIGEAAKKLAALKKHLADAGAVDVEVKTEVKAEQSDE